MSGNVDQGPIGTLLQMFDARRASSEAPFLRLPDGRSVTYGELNGQARQLAGALVAHGVRAGDRVAVQVEKSALAVALHVAMLRLGAVQLPLNPAYTDGEVQALLDDAEPVVVIRDPSRGALSGPWCTLTLNVSGEGSLATAAAHAEVFDDLVSLTADSPAALLYTSGTTGRPKGALLTHGNLVHNATTLVDEWGFTADDVLLHVLPLFHTHGLFVAVHCALASGSSIVLLPRFDVDGVLGQLPTCTVFMGVPTHYSRLLSDSRFQAPDVATMRLFVSGSAPMSKRLHAQFTDRTGHEVLERYGMTETSILTSNPLRSARRPGLVGPPLAGVSLQVVDDNDVPVAAHEAGKVLVRGPNVFSGYWRRPELQSETFTSDGWFRTGDIGRLDDDGWLELVGRSKDLIISGGLNVYPKEVEAVLDVLTGVHESAVIGLPDPDLGETVVAVVEPTAGANLDEAALLTAARRQLAGYKVPKRVVIVDELPRNAMGKVEKARLRAELSEPLR